MKVKCIYNEEIYLSQNILVKNFNTHSSSFPLTIDQNYIVYAMTIKDGYAWYYVCNEKFRYYPVWSPSPIFEVVDDRLSRYWIFSYKKGVNYIRARAMWAYPEWANDPDYYDKLTDGEEKEVELFNMYREKMDFEFPDSSILEIAQIGDDEWLICPDCIDAWQSKGNQDALVRCPKCWKIYNNPRYKNGWPHLLIKNQLGIPCFANGYN